MSEQKIVIGTEVYHKDHGPSVFNVVGLAKGWVTIEDSDGEQFKSRVSALTVVEYEDETGVCLRPDHSRYVKGDKNTPSGRATYDINDEVAIEMRAVAGDPDSQYELAASYLHEENPDKTQEEFKQELLSRYSNLNPGMQRMNLGNKIRGALNRMRKAEAEVEAKGEPTPNANDSEVELPLAA